MDLPDVELVVQWKATCDLCTLWQRFGHAGRGSDQLATAILLVEKKDTNEERLLKADRAAKRKAKKKEGIRTKRMAKDQLNTQRKRPGLANQNVDEGRVNDPDPDHDDIDTDNDHDVDVEMEEDDTGGNQGADEECCARYRNEGRSKITTGSSHVERGVEVGSAMDDYINSDSCRRKIPTLFFGNDKTRMSKLNELDLETDFSCLTATNNHILCDDTSPEGC